MLILEKLLQIKVKRGITRKIKEDHSRPEELLPAKRLRLMMIYPFTLAPLTLT